MRNHGGKKGGGGNVVPALRQYLITLKSTFEIIVDRIYY